MVFLKFFIAFHVIFQVAEAADTKMPKDLEASIKVIRLEDGKILYEKNPDLKLRPASLTKLFSSAYAYSKLGAFYGPKISFFYTGEIKNQELTGDLIIDGSMTPYLVSEDLWPMLKQLKQRGIDSIKGDLVLLAPWGKKIYREGLAVSKNAYNAPISTALSINFQTICVNIAPSFNPGEKAKVTLHPVDLDHITIENEVTTLNSNGKTNLQVTRQTDSKSKTIIKASGKITKDSTTQSFYRSVDDPFEASLDYMKCFLKEVGINLRGEARYEVKEISNKKELFSFTPKTMREILFGSLTFSNNFIADSVLLTLGTSANKLQDPFAVGVDGLNDWLLKTVKLSRIQLYDGSGLDLKNKVSSTDVLKLFSFIYKETDYFYDFTYGLAVSGKTGSLKNRFKDDQSYVIRAKTGTLTEPESVSAIAGIVQSKDSAPLAFSLLYNGVVGKKQLDISTLHLLQEEQMRTILGTVFKTVLNTNLKTNLKTIVKTSNKKL